MASTGKNKIRRKRLTIGITGNISSGKTFACRQFQKIAAEQKMEFHLLEVDQIRRDILYFSKDKTYAGLRKKLIKKLELKSDKDFSIHGEILGNKIFFDKEAMNFYRKTINPVILTNLKKKLNPLSGIILIEWAMLVEDGLLPVINDAVVMFTCRDQVRKNRLIDTDLPPSQLSRRLAYQGSESAKKKVIKSSIEAADKKLIIVDTSQNPPDDQYRKIFSQLINA